MAAHKIGWILGVLARSIDELTAVGHELQLPSVDARWHWLVTVKDSQEWLVVCGND